MTREEFSKVRHLLGKTQKEMAQLMGTSKKAIEAFEQGWRGVPPYVERQALFLMACVNISKEKPSPCWEILGCSLEKCRNCPAWEFRLGHLCWFINGTMCRGEAQKNWENKMRICRDCRVFKGVIPDLA